MGKVAQFAIFSLPTIFLSYFSYLCPFFRWEASSSLSLSSVIGGDALESISTSAKSHKDSEILVYLQENKLACYHFMDAYGEHKTLWQKHTHVHTHTQNLLLRAKTVAKVSAYLFWSPKLQFHRVARRERAHVHM